MDPFVSIVYCYRDRDLERVKLSLDSLGAQTNKNFKVYFVDYGSATKLASQVRSVVTEYDFVTYIYSDTRYMPWNRSHSLNIGLKEADTPYVFTADIDMIFVAGFVEALFRIASTNSATFFKVAYLKKKANLKSENLIGQVESYSADNALGLSLIPAANLKEINGYDEFYCFWGREDNDICNRLKQMDIKVQFHSEILMYHIYHEPANTNAVLPEKWLQFQNDYLHDTSKPLFRNSQNQWGNVTETSERDTLELIESSKTDYLMFNGYPRYFRFLLDSHFVKSKPGEILKFQFEDTVSDEYNSRTLIRFVNFFNSMLSWIKLPFSLKSNHDYSYVDVSIIRSEFYFWWASNKHEIWMKPQLSSFPMRSGVNGI